MYFNLCNFCTAMNILRHKRHIAAFRGLLVMLYFILFVSPLSHKFYLYANSPTRLLKIYVWEVSHQASNVYSHPSLLKHQMVSSLSVDKRYEMKHIFALFSPEFKVSFSYLENDRETCDGCRPSILSCPAVQLLRGPPSI
jgi:hypothetical protein